MLAAAVLCGAAAPANAGRLVPVQNPPAIAVPSDLSPDDVEQRIRAVLRQRQWRVLEAAPGYIIARQTRHGMRSAYSATIEVLFDRQGIQIRYRASEGLLYQQDGDSALIHSTYARWINTLAQDLAGQLGSPAPNTVRTN